MSDYGHDYTDDVIDALSRRMAKAYEQAAREMADKLKGQMREYAENCAEWEARIASGKATPEDYEAWRKDRAVDRKFVSGLADALARDATDTDRLARATINDEIPSVYAENANHAAYGIETTIGWNTHSFDLYDVSTVRKLIDEEPNLVPMIEIDGVRDYRWNKQKFSSAITQSVLQGESIPATAKRLKGVLGMDERASISAARTAMTSAENAGRIDSYKRAQNIGIQIEQEWVATLDERTRSSHRKLDGEHVPVGQKFSNDLRYPADPEGEGQEVWNCRCTLVAWSPEIAEGDAEVKRFSRLPKDMSYEEWKNGKKQEAEAKKKGTAKRYTNPSSPLWSQLGPNDPAQVSAKVDEMLAGSKGKVAQVWAKFEGQLVMADPVHMEKGTPKGAFYRSFDNAEGPRGVYTTVARGMANAGNRGTLATWFHEFGHHIDNIYNGNRRRWASIDYQGGKFAQTLKAEVDAKVKAVQAELRKEELEKAQNLPFSQIANTRDLYRRNKITYGQYKQHADALLEYEDIRGLTKDQARIEYGMSGDEYDRITKQGQKSEKAIRRAIGMRASNMEAAYRKVGEDITAEGLDTQLAIGDIYEGATRYKAVDTYGHGRSYWDAYGHALAQEAFAEFYSAECIYSERPAILDRMIKEFPEGYKVYTEIMEELAK